MISRAAVAPPDYLRPVSMVGGVVRARASRRVEIRHCAAATCGLTFWALVNGPNAAVFCSTDCHRASDERRGGRKRSA